MNALVWVNFTTHILSLLRPSEWDEYIISNSLSSHHVFIKREQAKQQRGDLRGFLVTALQSTHSFLFKMVLSIFKIMYAHMSSWITIPAIAPVTEHFGTVRFHNATGNEKVLLLHKSTFMPSLQVKDAALNSHLTHCLLLLCDHPVWKWQRETTIHWDERIVTILPNLWLSGLHIGL